MTLASATPVDATQSSSGNSPLCTCTGSAHTTPTNTAQHPSDGTATSPTPATASTTGSPPQVPASNATAPPAKLPGQVSPPGDPVEEIEITNRNDDFIGFVIDDVERRRAGEDGPT